MQHRVLEDSPALKIEFHTRPPPPVMYVLVSRWKIYTRSFTTPDSKYYMKPKMIVTCIRLCPAQPILTVDMDYPPTIWVWTGWLGDVLRAVPRCSSDEAKTSLCPGLPTTQLHFKIRVSFTTIDRITRPHGSHSSSSGSSRFSHAARHTTAALRTSRLGSSRTSHRVRVTEYRYGIRPLSLILPGNIPKHRSALSRTLCGAPNCQLN